MFLNTMWVSNVLLVVLYEQDDNQDTLMLGTDYYLTESGIASLLAEGKVPIGIGRETKIRMASSSWTPALFPTNMYTDSSCGNCCNFVDFPRKLLTGQVLITFYFVQRSILGEWSGLDYGVELQDTLMLGTDYYLTESEIASLLAEGKVPIGNALLTRTLMEFQRIFELKKADQQSILDDFNKHGPGFTEPSVSGAMPQVVSTHLHCRWTNKLSSGLSSRGLNQAHQRLLQELESSIS
ncbi:hypothetical protein F2Q70_00027379 [Brassica cretica]|uniref:Uncharacterized protein n=1 Tax=Brassica cretica TaxID=69181 RepID=A0A8S9LHI5_BRACR|nr:hypothetical protein F2Q70_00027379 [Brassica cretica]